MLYRLNYTQSYASKLSFKNQAKNFRKLLEKFNYWEGRA